MGIIISHPTRNRVLTPSADPKPVRLSVTFKGVSHGSFATREAAQHVAKQLVGARPRFRVLRLGHEICTGPLGVAHIENVT
jgi:hypothetical protein